MVYVHELVPSPGSSKEKQAKKVFRAGKKFSHMIADTEEELVAFATKMGMKEIWIQDAGTYRSHFDITESRFKKIVKQSGVKLVKIREFGVILKERQNAQRKSDLPRHIHPPQNPG